MANNTPTLKERLVSHHARIYEIKDVMSKVFGANNPMVLALENELRITDHINHCVKDNTYTHPIDSR